MFGRFPLREWRRNVGLELEEAACQLGVSAARLRACEKGHAELTATGVMRCPGVFGVTTGELMPPDMAVLLQRDDTGCGFSLPDGTILAVCETIQRAMGYESLQGRNLSELVQEADYPTTVVRAVSRLVSGQSSLERYRVRNVRADGELVPVEVHKTITRGAGLKIAVAAVTYL